VVGSDPESGLTVPVRVTVTRARAVAEVDVLDGTGPAGGVGDTEGGGAGAGGILALDPTFRIVQSLLWAVTMMMSCPVVMSMSLFSQVSPAPMVIVCPSASMTS